MFNLAQRRRTARLPQAEKSDNEDHHYNEADNIDDAVHVASSFFSRAFDGRALSGISISGRFRFNLRRPGGDCCLILDAFEKNSREAHGHPQPV